MKDILTLIKSEVPNFFINVINILSLPRTYPLQILYNSGKNKEDAIAKALTYYFLCMLMCGLFLTPIYGVETLWNIMPFIYSTLESTILIILSAVAMRISWNLVKCPGDYFDFFILLFYLMGTIFTFYLFITFINLAILKYQNPENYALVKRFTFLKDATAVDPFDKVLTDKSIAIYSIINIFSTLGAICWFCYSWKLFRIKMSASKSKSLGAFAIFSFLMLVVIFIDAALTQALSPHY